MCTREEFTEFTATMKCIYTLPTFLPDRESIEVWYVALHHFSYADLKKAFASYYPLNTFPPTLADFYRLLASPTNKSGVTAWGEVQYAVSKKNYDSVDDFTQSVVNKMGGWNVFRNNPPGNESFLMKQFISAYDESIEQETVNLLPEAMRRTMIGYNGQQLPEDIQT